MFEWLFGESEETKRKRLAKEKRKEELRRQEELLERKRQVSCISVRMSEKKTSPMSETHSCNDGADIIDSSDIVTTVIKFGGRVAIPQHSGLRYGTLCSGSDP